MFKASTVSVPPILSAEGYVNFGQGKRPELCSEVMCQTRKRKKTNNFFHLYKAQYILFLSLKVAPAAGQAEYT